MSDPRPRGRELVHQICAEIAALAATDEIDAISAIIVLPDGTLRMLSAYQKGKKLPLLAGMMVAQQQFITDNCCPVETEHRNSTQDRRRP